MKELKIEFHKDSNRLSVILILLCLLITGITFSPTLFNDLINWDDEFYIFENDLIRQLNFNSLVDIFSTFQFHGNYHPLTLVSLAVDYAISGYDPFTFHLTSYVLHLISTIIVFGIFNKLTDNTWIAFLVSLLFGIHPMHVEPVAWISSRKDVLYCFFYVLAMLSFLFYVKEKKMKPFYYTATLVLFLASLLSKGMAVTFPVILLSLDYLMQRKDYRKMLIEKTPFLILSIIFGLIAVFSQENSSALMPLQRIPITQSFTVACNGTLIYILKSIVPYNLSALHPWPPVENGRFLIQVYLSIPVIILLLIGVIVKFRKNRHILFGLGFFLISIALVSQFIVVGNKLIAERYSYISYLGLFYIFSYYFLKTINNNEIEKIYKGSLIVVGMVYILCLCSISFNRCKVWMDSEILWSDVISKFPDHYLGYASRGNHYYEFGNLDAALQDFNTSLRLEPNLYEIHNNRGVIFQDKGRKEKALEEFDACLEVEPNYINALYNRGLLLSDLNRGREALKDFQKMIELDSSNIIA